MSLEEELAELDAELDAIFSNKSDSLSLMALVENLLASQNQSVAQLRIGYSSRVTSTGRDFGLDQQGLVPGVSYYHKSGVFVDLMGYWNSALDPKYHVTVATIGYQQLIKNKWSYGVSYDHSFFSEKSEFNSLTDALSLSSSYYFKMVSTGVDYSFSFGRETAHRFIWGIGAGFDYITSQKVDKVSFRPTISLTFGTENVITQYINLPSQIDVEEIQSRLAQLRFGGENIRDIGIQRYATIHDYTFDQAEAILSAAIMLNNGTLSEDEISNFLSPYFTTIQENATFDLLNVYLRLPIMIYQGPLTLQLSYNYNVPKNLSNVITYDPNGYFGCTLTYNLGI